MEKTFRRTSSGLGFAFLLSFLFVVLHFFKVIKLTWIWILSPLWITLLLGLIVFTIVYIRILFKRKKRIETFRNKGKREEA